MNVLFLCSIFLHSGLKPGGAGSVLIYKTMTKRSRLGGNEVRARASSSAMFEIYKTET